MSTIYLLAHLQNLFVATQCHLFYIHVLLKCSHVLHSMFSLLLVVLSLIHSKHRKLSSIVFSFGAMCLHAV